MGITKYQIKKKYQSLGRSNFKRIKPVIKDR